MSQCVLPGELPFALQAPLVSAEQTVSTPEALVPETLEHGAYYAGKVGITPTVARWHAKKRRFVFTKFTMGQPSLRSLPHVADSDRRAGERFVPLVRLEPQNAYRVSDYAFETAG